MRTTVRLDEDLLRAAKIKAAQEGRTLTSLLEEGLRRVLAPEPARTGATALQEEAADFDRAARLEAAQAFLQGLPRPVEGSLFDDPEYQRLARKAGSDLPSHVLAVMDEEEDLDRLLRLDTTKEE